MSIYARLAAYALLVVAIFGGGYSLGTRLKQGQWDAATLAQEQADKAKAEAWNADITTQRGKHDEELRAINARLADALERLRKRSERMPEPARTACQGATGAELSGPDAGVLVRLANRADELRAALGQCQAWAETVSR